MALYGGSAHDHAQHKLWLSNNSTVTKLAPAEPSSVPVRAMFVRAASSAFAYNVLPRMFIRAVRVTSAVSCRSVDCDKKELFMVPQATSFL
jgi:hypothetical protein